jgi:urea transport system substrate-binding protein
MGMFPKDQLIGEMAQTNYLTIHLYAKAARLAGTTDQATLKKALESGSFIEAPEGAVFLDPATHHCGHFIRHSILNSSV